MIFPSFPHPAFKVSSPFPYSLLYTPPFFSLSLSRNHSSSSFWFHPNPISNSDLFTITTDFILKSHQVFQIQPWLYLQSFFPNSLPWLNIILFFFSPSFDSFVMLFLFLIEKKFWVWSRRITYHLSFPHCYLICLHCYLGLAENNQPKFGSF